MTTHSRTCSIVLLTSITIVSLAIVSGPLVTAIDLTPERADSESFGNGSAEVSIAAAPKTAHLDAGRYGAARTHLRVPEIVGRVDSVSGRPIIAYTIRIPELGYVRGEIRALSRSDSGRIGLQFDRTVVDTRGYNGTSYRGALTVVVREHGEERELYRGPITVEVDHERR